MKNKTKKICLEIVQGLLIIGLIIVMFLWGTGRVSSVIPETVLLFLTVVIFMMIIVVWFYLKFRVNTAEYDFHYVTYNKTRGDIEEKIRELQKAINENDAAWCDNNHLVLAGQDKKNFGWKDIDSNLENQFGIVKQLEVNEKKVFMLMPFNLEAMQVYAQCRETVRRLGMELKKSDDGFIEGDLLKSIVADIIMSGIIIANLDGKNPNVFYELGIAHTLGKKTILITRYKPEEMPFNIKNKFIIFYETMEQLDERLGMAIEHIM